MNKNKKAASPKNKSMVGIVIILIAIAAMLGAKYIKTAINLSQKKSSESKLKGVANAPIQITEFADLQCPACANGAKLLKKIMDEHPQSIRLQFKYFPLAAVHQHSILASRYAECSAEQGKFWAFSDEAFGRQDQWKGLFDAHPAFDQIAKDIGLNTQALNTCLQDPKVDDLIEKNRAEGKALGVQSTPTYFINAVMVVGTKNLELELEKYLSAQAH
jgi:protein-disulfide isomerase